jgi:hypothetical protein
MIVLVVVRAQSTDSSQAAGRVCPASFSRKRGQTSSQPGRATTRESGALACEEHRGLGGSRTTQDKIASPLIFICKFFLPVLGGIINQAVVWALPACRQPRQVDYGLPGCSHILATQMISGSSKIRWPAAFQFCA